MPYYAVVVKDAQLAHDREIHRNVEANVKVHGEKHRKKITRLIQDRYNHPPRPEGTLHCHGERGCPDGEPWCENCGDPAHAAECLIAGHCEACVLLRHGAVAHPAVLAANGYTLVETDPPASPTHVWHPTEQRFVQAEDAVLPA